ncbi:MAG: DinB family protein [Dyadobacter sp.]|uniref:DinB family protein n=1 Tax=Dyadobacter sp. TaxID=1914288 RepID=UPI003263B3E2
MKEQLKTILTNSKSYTLAVAAAMPADTYGFKPVDTVWNFGELLNHIGYGIYWWEENYIRGIETDWNPPASLTSKSKIATYLLDAFEMLEKTLAELSDRNEAIAGFHTTLDHITHHRGQATTYLRCCGITPPEYIY